MSQTHKLQHSRLVSRSPIFYGWVIWAVAMLGLIATSPGQSYTVSLFIDHFITDFNLDRTTVSGLYGLGTFIASFSLTFVGRRIDRHGNRAMGVVISALFAIALVGMSLVNGPVALVIGFIAIRGLGQGSLSLVSGTAITQWFRQRRGRVMSLALVGFSLFQSAYVPALQNILETTDWRQVWIMLSIGVAVTILPLTLLLMRNRPEDFGLNPDGLQAVVAGDSAGLAPPPEDNWTLHEAIRTPIFWIFLLGAILPTTWGTGLILHQISIFESLGYEGAVAAQTFSQFSIISASVALVAGVLIDRFRPGWVLAFELLALLLAMSLATVMTEMWMVVLYALVFGAALGTAGVFSSTVWTNLFGRQHQGSIRGFTVMGGVVGSAIGPIIFGYSFDYLGGYRPVLLLGVFLAAVAIVASLFAKLPTHTNERSA